MAFLICAHCNRHVKSDASACPFCGEKTEAAAVAGNPAQAGARSRSKLLFGAAAAAVAGAAAVTGCSGSSTSSPVPLYGGVVVDGGDTEGGPVALYGGPVVEDAGSEGGVATPAYGAPSH